MRCGAKLPALAAVAPPVQALPRTQRDYTTTIHHLSAGSMFKIAFVTYGLLLGVVGCFFVAIPGVLGSALLGGLIDDRYSMGLSGGGVVSTLVVYALLVVVGAFVQGAVAAVAALVYNLVAGWVGGIRVDLKE